MAIINCPECKKEISDKANSCPNCGYVLNNFSPAKKNGGSGGSLLWTIGVLMVLIIIFATIGHQISKSDPTTSSLGSNTEIFMVYNVAKEHVKARLKSPSTAEFPGRREKYKHVAYTAYGQYRINSWVDSQNSFGAMLRSRWSCYVRIVDDNTVQVTDLVID